MEHLVQNPWMILVAGLLLIGILVGSCWAVWHLVDTHVSPTAARVWALAVTLLLPVIILVAWRLGQVEARGKLTGIDAAIDKVMAAASQAIDVRVSAARAMRQAKQPPLVVLPDPDSAIKVRSQLMEGEVVELE